MCAFKIEFILFSAFAALLILFLTGSNQQVFSQSPGGVVSAPQLESVKIVNLLAGQNVDSNKELLVTGESSDNASKDCSVYVIVNNVQPYQNAAADGAGGTRDFSQWKFVLHDSYTHLNEGQNKITAKLLCSSSPTRWYSVVVNGVAGSNMSNAPAIMDTTSPQTNESEQAPIDTTVQQEQAPIDTTVQQTNETQAPIDTTVQQTNETEAPIDTTVQQEQAQIDTTASQTNETEAPIDTTVQQTNETQAPIDTTVQQTNETQAPIDTTAPQSNAEVETQTDTTSTIDTLTSQRNVTEPSVETSPSQPSGLIVKILPLKDPLARGDSQNATIIVTDSDNNPISDAQIDGNLVYPGNNFEKGFKGTTDVNGKFVYSWIAGKKGDVGPLVIQVDVSDEGHSPTHAEISVDLVESDQSSQILDPFQSNFEQP